VFTLKIQKTGHSVTCFLYTASPSFSLGNVIVMEFNHYPFPDFCGKRMGLRFELRALRLQSSHSTTLSPLPTHLVLVILEMASYQLSAQADLEL
jgi:hypothetical protein